MGWELPEAESLCFHLQCRTMDNGFAGELRLAEEKTTPTTKRTNQTGKMAQTNDDEIDATRYEQQTKRQIWGMC